MRRLRPIFRVILGLSIGLVLAEAVFSWRADGAFPHINVLQADAALAVKLIPGKSQRIKIAANPTSTLTIGDDGWRTTSAKGSGGIVVVGDSQVFGLGVDDDETTPAQLAALTGQPVINAGVPTYGPEEYLKVIAELCQTQAPETVVVVVNFSNDLFELGRTNLERHQVWDGWAVRLETAPDQITDFPGRRWLFSRSHVVYALRQFLHTPDETDDGRGFPSEGSITDAMNAMLSHQLAVSGTPEEEIEALLDGLTKAQRNQHSLNQSIQDKMRHTHPLSTEQRLALEAVERRAQVGDIVSNKNLEAARNVAVTAAMLRQGARLKRNMRADFEQWLSEHPEHSISIQLKAGLEEQQSLTAQLDTLSEQVAINLTAISPFKGFLERAHALTEAAGAGLAVVALPMDVQVDPEEWSKYGKPEEDMSETLTLLSDLTQDAHRMGLRALDATASLQGAQPGAFLDADIHLTPKGHAALAAAIAQILSAPAPLPQPAPGLPEGRSRIPLAIDWTGLEENIVRGSTRNNCTTQRIREWQRVTCRTPHSRQWQPVSVSLQSGSAETMLLSLVEHTDLITPLLPGQDLIATFFWSNRTEELRLTWEGDEPVLGFTPVEKSPPPEPTSSRLKTCLKEQTTTITDLFGDEQAEECATTWSECEAVVSCAQGAGLRPPTCLAGEGNAGAAGLCHALCDERTPCQTGTCREWMGAQVCL
ncbi:MAG: hypothetical protein P8R54_23235 [Myxococcota bacterium]|nr:hypothetical protein [Myxococcota bacterium]